jgi:hexosaminidase
VQANLWTEYIPIKEVAEYMVLPRMAALAEVQWTNADKKDFNDFEIRITRLSKIYDKYGWKYALHLWPERMKKDRWHN